MVSAAVRMELDTAADELAAKDGETVEFLSEKMVGKSVLRSYTTNNGRVLAVGCSLDHLETV